MRRIETIVVRKRFGNELTDVRDFVRPRDYMVVSIVNSRPSWTPRAMWQWVIENIRYPPGGQWTLDWHMLFAFRSPVLPLPGKIYQTIDFWEFPAEVLRDGEADCEGSSVLLVSMLRRAWPGIRAYVTVGWFKTYGHVWSSINQSGRWYILDTTLRRLPPVTPTENQNSDYRPLFRFNDEEVIVAADEVVVPELVRRKPHKDAALQSWYLLLERSAYGRR